MSDPDRLLDTTDDAALRELLDAGARELPTAAQLDQLASKLPLGPGGSPPPAGVGGASKLAGLRRAVSQRTSSATTAFVPFT